MNENSIMNNDFEIAQKNQEIDFSDHMYSLYQKNKKHASGYDKEGYLLDLERR